MASVWRVVLIDRMHLQICDGEGIQQARLGTELCAYTGSSFLRAHCRFLAAVQMLAGGLQVLMKCTMQLPVGADRFGYGMSTKDGRIVHEREPKSYASSCGEKGTVLGFYIYLPSRDLSEVDSAETADEKRDQFWWKNSGKEYYLVSNPPFCSVRSEKLGHFLSKHGTPVTRSLVVPLHGGAISQTSRGRCGPSAAAERLTSGVMLLHSTGRGQGHWCRHS